MQDDSPIHSWTLAEEMPVAESIEYVQALRERTKLAFGPLFINGLVPEPQNISLKTDLPKKLQVYADYYRLARERAALQKSTT